MSAYTEIKFHVEGTAPLLMHNGQLANPLNPIVRELKTYTGRRKKTDDDLVKIFELEFLGGLYLDDKGRVIVPGESIEAMLWEAATKFRKGQQAKAGLMSDGLWPLLYDGPKDAKGLWANPAFRDVRSAIVDRKRIQRCRPRFNKWSLKFAVQYLPELLDERDVREFVEIAGRQLGLCDYTPRFGRFMLAA